MFAWDRIRMQLYAQQASSSSGRLDSRFTNEEQSKLEALRTRAEILRASEVSGLDPKYLAYARWLVEHDYVSEEMVTRESAADASAPGAE